MLETTSWCGGNGGRYQVCSTEARSPCRRSSPMGCIFQSSTFLPRPSDQPPWPFRSDIWKGMATSTMWAHLSLSSTTTNSGLRSPSTPGTHWFTLTSMPRGLGIALARRSRTALCRPIQPALCCRKWLRTWSRISWGSPWARPASLPLTHTTVQGDISSPWGELGNEPSIRKTSVLAGKHKMIWIVITTRHTTVNDYKQICLSPSNNPSVWSI